MPSNAYDVLGVPPTASPRLIQRAYHRLALSTHPDVEGDPRATAAFVRVKEAYEAVSDPAARAVHDITVGLAAARELRYGTTEPLPDRKTEPPRRRRFERRDRTARKRSSTVERDKQRRLAAAISGWQQSWKEWDRSRAECTSAADAFARQAAIEPFWGLYESYRECAGLVAPTLADAEAASQGWEEHTDGGPRKIAQVMQRRRLRDLGRIEVAREQADSLNAQVGEVVQAAGRELLEEQLALLWDGDRPETNLLLALVRLRGALAVGDRFDEVTLAACALVNDPLPEVVVGTLDQVDEADGAALLVCVEGRCAALVRIHDFPGSRVPRKGARFSYVLQRTCQGPRAIDLLPEPSVE